MALPLPNAPLAIPTDWQDRGTSDYSPLTKSTRSKVSYYVEKDACDQDAYQVAQASMSIVQNSPDCRSVLAGTVSISVRIPIDGEAVDSNLLIDHVQTLIATRIAAATAQ